MPIYEYQCEACGHVFEKLQKISDAALTKCPDCDAEALKKLVSAVSNTRNVRKQDLVHNTYQPRIEVDAQT